MCARLGWAWAAPAIGPKTREPMSASPAAVPIFIAVLLWLGEGLDLRLCLDWVGGDLSRVAIQGVAKVWSASSANVPVMLRRVRDGGPRGSSAFHRGGGPG